MCDNNLLKYGNGISINVQSLFLALKALTEKSGAVRGRVDI